MEYIKKSLMVLLVLTLFFLNGFCEASDKSTYNRALTSARSHNNEFAFMYFRQLVRDYPNSCYVPEAIFAQGEYYFSIPNYEEAFLFFEEYIDRYPDSQAAIFALAHQLKIAQLKRDKDLAKEIEKKIISVKQVGLVFTDFKQYEYKTPLDQKFLAVFHIDKIEFYADDTLFAKISY